MRSNTGRLIDELGEVRKQIADLTEKEERLKSTIKEFGEGMHNGTTYCVKVSHIERKTLDPKKVARRLTPVAFRACYRKQTVTEVRVTARNAATGRRSAAGSGKVDRSTQSVRRNGAGRS